MMYIIDRFEGDYAILLLRNDESIQIDLLRESLPNSAKEGDIIEVSFDNNNNVIESKILKEETESAKKRAENLLKKILEKNSKS